jgi:hypothetical protein
LGMRRVWPAAESPPVMNESFTTPLCVTLAKLGDTIPSAPGNERIDLTIGN